LDRGSLLRLREPVTLYAHFDGTKNDTYLGRLDHCEHVILIEQVEDELRVVTRLGIGYVNVMSVKDANE
jgi:hypothetical protein